MLTTISNFLQDPIAIISLIISGASLTLAIIQTQRLAQAEREQKRKFWSLIATSKALMEDLEHKDPNQAAGKVYEIFRFLLREAVSLERNYNLQTLNNWRKVGKISSDWQHRQALMLLDTKEINILDANKLSIDFQIWDSNPPKNLYNHHDDRLEANRPRFKKDSSGVAVPIDENDYALQKPTNEKRLIQSTQDDLN